MKLRKYDGITLQNRDAQDAHKAQSNIDAHKHYVDEHKDVMHLLGLANRKWPIDFGDEVLRDHSHQREKKQGGEKKKIVLGKKSEEKDEPE